MYRCTSVSSKRFKKIYVYMWILNLLSILVKMEHTTCTRQIYINKHNMFVSKHSTRFVYTCTHLLVYTLTKLSKTPNRKDLFANQKHLENKQNIKKHDMDQCCRIRIFFGGLDCTIKSFGGRKSMESI